METIRRSTTPKLMAQMLAPMLMLMVAVLLVAPRSVEAEARWGVHVASFRSQAKATIGWQKTLHRHPDLLASLAGNYVPVDIPGKGRFTRVIAGMFEDRARALELARELRKRGAFADVLPLIVEEPEAVANPQQALLQVPKPAAPKPVAAAKAPKIPAPDVAAQRAPQPVVKSVPVALSPAPAKPVVAAPAAPRMDYQGRASQDRASQERARAEGLAAGDGVPLAPARVMAQRVKVLAKGMNELHKYVPGPVASGRKDGDERELAPLPKRFARNADTPDNAPSAGFKDEDSIAEDGLTLARPRRNNGRISAQYGDMTRDYETPAKLAPTAPDAWRKDMKPYVGLGIHF